MKGACVTDEHGLLARLDELHTLLGAAGNQKLEAVLDHLRQAVQQIVVEHAGMVEELLSVYEQLGVVFEVTRRLPSLQEEPEVISLFLQCMQQSFGRRQVSVLRRGNGSAWRVEGCPLRVDPWIEALIDRARETQKVHVEPVDGHRPPMPFAEIMAGPVFAGSGFVCAIVLTRAPDAPPFRAADMLLLESLLLFCGDMIRNLRLVRELRDTSIAMVRALVNAVDQKDEYTSGHSQRVGYFATMLGKRIGLSEGDLQMLEWAALLHDVGKIGIRDDVLKKTGRLTDEEFAHMKEHPVRSHKVVQQVPQLAAALDGVLYHHERYDGKGYPAGLKGEHIPFQARLIQIADIFDALTSNRSYRAAFHWTKALAIMQEEAGTTVDPSLQKVFDTMIRERLAGGAERWDQMIEEASGFAARAPGVPHAGPDSPQTKELT